MFPLDFSAPWILLHFPYLRTHTHTHTPKRISSFLFLFLFFFYPIFRFYSALSTRVSRSVTTRIDGTQRRGSRGIEILVGKEILTLREIKEGFLFSCRIIISFFLIHCILGGGKKLGNQNKTLSATE